MPIMEELGIDSPDLVGSPGNKARDPNAKKTRKGKGKGGDGSVGDQALMDSIILIALAWGLLLVLFYSVRGHNV